MKAKTMRVAPLHPGSWIKAILTIASLSSIYACQKPPSLEGLRNGLASKVVPGSYTLSVDPKNNNGESLSELKEEARLVAEEQGCELGGLQAVSWEPGAISAELASTFQLRFTNCEQSEEQVAETIRTLQNVTHVKNVQAEALYQSAVAENDPKKGKQYHLDKINRDQACDLLGGKAGIQVIVAIVDTGVERDHPDLKDQFLRDANGKVIGANFVGKGASGKPDDNWDDQHGHGTHVAGLVGATARNGIGVVGVASCGNVKIMPVRVLNASGSNVEIERGVQWAAAHGADVINISIGSEQTYNQRKESIPSALYSDLDSKGVIVFAASGNSGLMLGANNGSGYIYGFPASYDKVISVASSNADDNLSSFSNRGATTVDIAAPGEQDGSTVMGGGYDYMSGTSMASPVAAGAYALALSIARTSPNYRMKHDEVQAILLKSVRTNNYKTIKSGGVLDAHALAQAMLNGRSDPTVPDPTTPDQGSD